jgi:hypothetical protein
MPKSVSILMILFFSMNMHAMQNQKKTPATNNDNQMSVSIVTQEQLERFHDGIEKNESLFVKRMLNHNAQGALLPDARGDNALHIAMQRRSKDEIIDMLIDHDSTILASENKSGSTPLMSAVIWNNRRGVERLLSIYRSQVNVQHVDHYGRTALDYAAWLGYIKIANMLVVAGAQEDVLSALSIVECKHPKVSPIRKLFKVNGEHKPALKDEVDSEQVVPHADIKNESAGREVSQVSDQTLDLIAAAVIGRPLVQGKSIEQSANPELVLHQTTSDADRKKLLSERLQELNAALAEFDEMPIPRSSEHRAPACLEDENRSSDSE